MHTIQTLKRDLREMGFMPEDTILVHSSMKSIGEVEGRADAVLDALTEYFAPGLLAFPTLTWDIAGAHSPRFDVMRSPSQVGLLPELFRKRPGAYRSWHPTHSLAAIGADAQRFTAEDHRNHTPCGPRSGWRKLVERDGRVLMIGCGLTSSTLIHGIEEWCGVPNRLADPVTFTVVAPDGDELEVISSPHLGSPSEQYGRAERALRECGALVDGRFGSAPALVLSARGCFDALSSLLSTNPGLFDEESPSTEA